MDFIDRDGMIKALRPDEPKLENKDISPSERSSTSLSRAEQQIVISVAFGPPQRRAKALASVIRLYRAAGAEWCVASLAACPGPERLGAPRSSSSLQNKRKRLLRPSMEQKWSKTTSADPLR
jgi:hypothetical protein